MARRSRDAEDFYFNITADKNPYSIVHKFGRNAAVSTTFAPVTIGGVYRTPQVGSATAVRVKAGNANDTSDGSGAREITVQGVNSEGVLVTEALATNGASAGSNSSNSFIRLFRAWVSKSGTYATQSAGSHSADIVIENSAGSEDWLTIDSANFPKGQSEIAVYTVPKGKKAYISSALVYVDSNNTADIILFQRTGILQTEAPYDAMRIVIKAAGVSGESDFAPKTPLGPYDEFTDFGFMARVTAGNVEVECDMEIILQDK